MFSREISKAPLDCVLCFCDTIALKTPTSREKNDARRYFDYCGITTTEYKWTTKPFETELFSGGNEANTYLKKLGFEIQQKTISWIFINSNVAVKKDKSSFIHYGTGINMKNSKCFGYTGIKLGYR
ncbi:MAG TPA: hypothetical protein VFE71_08695 [Bacteroidales bacterium]|nr:hypothetical protein [Bacteroidales bacterium]